MTPERRLLLIRRLRATGEFFRCPGSGRILIAGSSGDDKILCPCGEQSPGAERMRRIKQRDTPLEPPGTHIKAFLPDAAVEDYLDQEIREGRWS